MTDPFKAISSEHAKHATMSKVQMDRARERAEARAEEKASRAVTIGLKLPKKKRKGWDYLRDKLEGGTLLPALRQIELADPELRKKRQSSFATTFAGLAKKVTGATKSFMMSGTEEKRILMDAKAEHEKAKRQREEREKRRKLIKRQKKLERELEYLNFPTIMGWYFDGFFTPYFQLNEEWAAMFNSMELEISKNKENSIKETFAEKAKRYFWPPDVIGGLCFRTRGIYLDFNDIMKDPPHTPPDIVLDQRMEAVTLFMATETTEVESKVASEEDEEMQRILGTEELAAEEHKLQQMLMMIENEPSLTDEEKARKKKAILLVFKRKKERAMASQAMFDEMHFKAISRNDYYFDDQIPGFFKKRARDRDKYYFDKQWDVWRVKRKIIHFPNDYYWDEQLALFFPKDRTRPPDYYVWDPQNFVYRVGVDSTPPNWRGVKPSHFYFDHQLGKWVKKSSAPAGVMPYMDQNGHRLSANKKNDGPDDFYYDAQTSQFEKKIPDGKLYFYDPSFNAWRKVGDPYPGKMAPKPFDFYWNEKEFTFVKKDAPSSFFDFDQNNKFFRKKRSLHGKFHPKNWTWNEKKKQWELKKFLGRHLFMSESLYWRPDRDYDKPWLEYAGGYKDYHIGYDIDRWDEEDFQVGPPGAAGSKATGKPGGPASAPPTGVTRSEPVIPKKGILSGAGGGETSKTAPEGGGRRVSMTGVKKDGDEKEKKKDENPSETLMFVDTLDRKVLKVTGLGDNITDVDLRKYFASVKKIVRPKVPGTELNEDYAYLKFKTEEAAAAALKTMHEQHIKGTEIALRYKLKAEDETRGGQRDVGAEKQSSAVKK